MKSIFNKNNWSKTKPYPDRKEMTDFLLSHFRYDTMNSWNRSTSYANNVKLHNLDLASENIDINTAFDFLASECDEYNFEIDDLIHDFEADTGYTAGFNGRSSGYIVMYETSTDKTGKRVTYPGRNIDQYLEDEIDEWDIEEIKARYALVKRFDTLCDDIRSLFISYCRDSKTVDIIYLEPKKTKISICRDCEDEDVNIIFEKSVPDEKIYVRHNEIDENFIADIPALGIKDIAGNTIEQCIMYAQKAILDYNENKGE